jgi:hypothetical protein
MTIYQVGDTYVHRVFGSRIVRAIKPCEVGQLIEISLPDEKLEIWIRTAKS